MLLLLQQVSCGCSLFISQRNNVIIIDKRDYIFRSFWDREDCYRILVTFLEKFRSGGKIEGIPRTQSDAPMMEQLQSSTSTTSDSNYAAGATSLKASPSSNEPGNTLSMKRSSTAISRPVSVAVEQTANDDVIDAGMPCFTLMYP